MSEEVIETKPKEAKENWKQKFAHEFVQYWVDVIYLGIFFGAFAWYRRLVLAEYGISYLNYGTAIIEALILAKVILIGEAMGLGRGDKNKPLIYPTLRKAVVFSIFVGIFAIIEHMIGGILHGKGVAGGLALLWHEGKFELLARCLVTFCAFIPFFAFRELEMTLGVGRFRRLFFRKGVAAQVRAQLEQRRLAHQT
jgi:hypothetical protein